MRVCVGLALCCALLVAAEVEQPVSDWSADGMWSRPLVEDQLNFDELLEVKETHCAAKHRAGIAACHVYGQHSPLCTGTQTQYQLQCSHEPRPSYTPALGEALNLKAEVEATEASRARSYSSGDAAYNSGEGYQSGGYQSGGYQSGAKKEEKAVAVKKTLEDELTPALQLCQIEYDKSKLNCQKAVAKKFSEWKANQTVAEEVAADGDAAEPEEPEEEAADGDAAEPEEPEAAEESEPSKAAASESELGEHAAGGHESHVQALYDEAIGTMHPDQARQLQDLMKTNVAGNDDDDYGDFAQ
jgi:hypothetical protein